MSRQKIEILFLTILLALTLILFSSTVIYKSNLIDHPLTYPIFGIIAIGFIYFNYQVLNLQFTHNILYSLPIILISFVLSFLINGQIISLMLKFDQGRTSLGWTYNYNWFALLIFGLLLVVSTEVIGIRINKK